MLMNQNQKKARTLNIIGSVLFILGIILLIAAGPLFISLYGLGGFGAVLCALAGVALMVVAGIFRKMARKVLGPDVAKTPEAIKQQGREKLYGKIFLVFIAGVGVVLYFMTQFNC